ncbi:MAG: hypothetical protein VW397_00700 [Candidatus Margulisiibacteriota bacterium]
MAENHAPATYPEQHMFPGQDLRANKSDIFKDKIKIMLMKKLGIVDDLETFLPVYDKL